MPDSMGAAKVSTGEEDTISKPELVVSVHAGQAVESATPFWRSSMERSQSAVNVNVSPHWIWVVSTDHSTCAHAGRVQSSHNAALRQDVHGVLPPCMEDVKKGFDKRALGGDGREIHAGTSHELGKLLPMGLALLRPQSFDTT